MRRPAPHVWRQQVSDSRLSCRFDELLLAVVPLSCRGCFVFILVVFVSSFKLLSLVCPLLLFSLCFLHLVDWIFCVYIKFKHTAGFMKSMTAVGLLFRVRFCFRFLLLERCCFFLLLRFSFVWFMYHIFLGLCSS